MAGYEKPRFLDASEAALSIEFGDAVDPEINARVLALDAALQRAQLEGVTETLPTYRALLVGYEPLVLSRETLIASAQSLLADAPPDATAAAPARWRLPCCYEPPCGEDLAEASAALGLSPARFVELHAGADYRAYMYGFAPGWCYLGGLPEVLALPRRATPRAPTPPGAVLIGGGLALVASNPMPTGWYVIGRTPERLFLPKREPPLFIAPGDLLRFEPVDLAAFRALDARAAEGERVAVREGGA
ncbi:5-oxoprolinase subunit B family protein [Methylocystis bryophila]|uniref:Allophanate hydrolase n=1 Tax=Methylocystis bryophila TaxID=655015 RepID=A0A1W6MTC2_9HYPH|nr:allophanate hydrolase subunit 1 [Methylocystis bryophila]ARN80873.1 allophanate hydrolase [Methylocystis bryophila]BDV36754.1 allophanate hydrolase [Methylocystis bryophila]